MLIDEEVNKSFKKFRLKSSKNTTLFRLSKKTAKQKKIFDNFFDSVSSAAETVANIFLGLDCDE